MSDDEDQPGRTPGHDLPVLRERVGRELRQLELPVTLPEDVLAELETEIASRICDLTDRLLQTALMEVEAALFAQVSDRLREQLPEIVERAIADVLDRESD